MADMKVMLWLWFEGIVATAKTCGIDMKLALEKGLVETIVLRLTNRTARDWKYQGFEQTKYALECLYDIDVHGNKNDVIQAVYPTKEQFRRRMIYLCAKRMWETETDVEKKNYFWNEMSNHST